MLFFLRACDGAVFYLLNNKQYSVGRKLCDILISDDQSISRKHAVLNVNNNRVTVLDQGSRYNTFVNKTKIESDKEVSLNKGDEIQFGMLKSIYMLDAVAIITTTSSIKNDQKINLRNNINFLGGTLQNNWSVQCTHVTVEEIMLTAKVLCAVIQGIPIVMLKYWDDYVNNVKQNSAPPDVTDYVPNCSETILSKNISLEYKEERKDLFRNKVFVFPTKTEKAKIVDMIVLAGGEAISWDINPLERADVHNASKEYIILQTSELIDRKMSNDLVSFINYYTQTGKRTIPLQEIALAIVKCSCEKDCNPDFDRKGTVLAASTQKQIRNQSENVLAFATQSLSLIPSENVKSETIVSQSFENDVNVISVCDVKNDDGLILNNSTNEVNNIITKTSPVEEEIPSSIKRESESIDNLNASKKIKLESPFIKKNIQKKDTPNSIEVKSDPIRNSGSQSGRTLFAFKRDKVSNENASSSNESINPFSRKRKLVQNENNENPPKKSPIDDVIAVPSTSFVATPKSKNVVPNPFANILKSKNCTPSSSINSSQSSFTYRSKPSKSKNSAINEEVNSLEVDSTKIIVVDVYLERSYGWLSKSTCSVDKEHTVNEDKSTEDPELLKYIESFKNTVIIDEEKEPIYRRSLVADNNNDSTVTNNNFKNFKKFKKVQPIKIQTTIIPESSYVDVVCNHNSAIQMIRPDSDEDSDDAVDSQARAPKRKGKRYEFV